MPDEYEEQEDKTLFMDKKVLLVVLLAFGMLIFFRWKQELFTIGFVDLAFLIIMVWFIPLWRSAVNAAKHWTNKFVAHGMHTTTIGPYPFGAYYVFTKGDIDFGQVVRLRGSEGTVIVPRILAKFNGRNWVSNGRPRIIAKEEIPDDIRLDVVGSRKCKPPYYCIYADETLIENCHDVEFLIAQNRKLERKCNMVETISKAALTLKEDVTESWGRMESTKQESNIQKIRERLVGKKEEE